jgi:hypothetical protein
MSHFLKETCHTPSKVTKISTKIFRPFLENKKLSQIKHIFGTICDTSHEGFPTT